MVTVPKKDLMVAKKINRVIEIIMAMQNELVGYDADEDEPDLEENEKDEE